MRIHALMFRYIFSLYSFFFFKFEEELAVVTHAYNKVALGRLREEDLKSKVSLS